MDPAPGHTRPPRPNLTAEERNAIWEHATRVAADATAQIRALAGTDPAAAADAAWATSDTLHVAAAMLGSRILRQAADAYDRAARAPYGRIPPPTPAGNQLRQAARLLSAFAYLTQRPVDAPRSCSSPGWPRSPKPSPNSANPSSTPPRPPPPAPPPNGSTPPPARHQHRHHAQLRAPSTAAQLAGLSFPTPAAARPLSIPAWTTRPRSRRPTATTQAVTATATRPQSLTARSRHRRRLLVAVHRIHVGIVHVAHAVTATGRPAALARLGQLAARG